MISGIDHIALPMQNVEEMITFYRLLGGEVREEVPGFLHSVYLGHNKINLHLPVAWQSPNFTLRGHPAVPGCGDMCFVWGGTVEEIQAKLSSMGVEIIEGPVERVGGLKETGISVYVRDPDENLLEFIVY